MRSMWGGGGDGGKIASHPAQFFMHDGTTLHMYCMCLISISD